MGHSSPSNSGSKAALRHVVLEGHRTGAPFVSRHLVAFGALVYGCYVCTLNSHISDNASVAREFSFNFRITTDRCRLRAMDDPRITGNTVTALNQTKHDDGKHLPKEQHMNIQAKYRSARASLQVLWLGLATAAVFSLILMFSPFVGPSGDTQSAAPTVNVLAQVRSVPLVHEANAAVITAAPNEQPAPHIRGGDSRFDDYRLERDSCCIGN